jgi:hypothetical protein
MLSLRYLLDDPSTHHLRFIFSWNPVDLKKKMPPAGSINVAGSLFAFPVMVDTQGLVLFDFSSRSPAIIMGSSPPT